MSTFPATLSAVIGLAAAAALVPAPAVAQSNDRISEIIVYGSDPCPRSTDDEVVVCARKSEEERYRIPERFRSGGPRQTRQSWAMRAKSFETVGRTGINSCSAVGPGGHTGCLQSIIDQAKAEVDERAVDGSPPEE